MFNEMDREALAEAASIITKSRGTRTWELTVDELAAALDAAGIIGLFHDGTRVEKLTAGKDPFARIRD